METLENKEFVYEFGRFVLNPKERLLSADGKVIHLPAKEFETLLFLVEHNGRAISKEEMMSAIWQDAFVEESNLAKQISRLRKLLNKKGDQFIETLPKHGYRFKAELHRTVWEPDEPLVVEKRRVQSVTLEVDDDAGPEIKALKAGRQRSFTIPLIAAIALLALGIGAAWLWKGRGQTSGVRVNTIAVLPIRTLTEQEDDKILAAGITDALITKLGSLKPMIVRPARAVAQFADIQDSAEIGRKLNVNNILEGTLLRADSKLRVNMRLIDAQTGEQVWTEKFDSPFTGVFDLEDRISENAAHTLLAKLESDTGVRATKRYTENAQAFDAYLKGRYFWNKRTEESFRQAIGYFDQAVAIDPDYALAYSGLADCYILLGVWGTVPPNEVFPQARQAAEKALAADPDLAEARVSLAFVEWVHRWDFPKADADFQRAIQLNPNYATAHHWYSYYLVSMGRNDEAISEIKKARELEGPLTLSVNTDIGEIYSWAGRYDEAAEYLNEVLKIEPKYAVAHHVLGINLLKQGRYSEAISEEETARQLESEPRILAVLSYAYAAGGDREKAKETFNELKGLAGKKYVSPFSLAIGHLGLGETTEALSMLDAAYSERSDTMAILNVYPLLASLRSEPRFIELQSRIGY